MSTRVSSMLSRGVSNARYRAVSDVSGAVAARIYSGNRARGARATQDSRSNHREESESDGCDSIGASESHRQRNDTTARRESDDERWKSDAGNAGDGVFESRHGDGRVRRRGVTSESAENVGAEKRRDGEESSVRLAVAVAFAILSERGWG